MLESLAEIDGKILGAIIGAFAAIFGVLIGNFLMRQYENKKLHRIKKQEVYSNLLRYIIRIKNKHSEINIHGDKLLKLEHQKELFDEFAEIKIWSLKAEVFCSRKYRKRFKEINSILFNVDKLEKSSEKKSPTSSNISIVKKKYTLTKGIELEKEINMQDLNSILVEMLGIIKKDLKK